MQKLCFDGFEFSPVTHLGQPYLTLPEVARVLYGKGGHQSDVPLDKGLRQTGTLYRRHADEFSSSMTDLVKVATDGGEQLVRVFSLRGCHLLGMLARTEHAKMFRRWVLDVIDERAGQTLETMPEFNRALIEFISKRAVASLCGRGLVRWRDERRPLEQKVDLLAAKMQPALF